MIKVISSGFYSTLQDGGRFRHRAVGIPLSGAMDLQSFELANKLVGNLENATVLEITASGPVLFIEMDVSIAITGAAFSPTINGVNIPSNSLQFVKRGSTLKFGRLASGMRAYLSIKGGFKAEKVLGSYSQYAQITQKRTIVKGDTLDAGNETFISEANYATGFNLLEYDNDTLQVFKGPEFGQLPDAIQSSIENVQLTILPQSNRMAYLLSGFDNTFQVPEIITSPVQPGTVQLTPSGSCAVLMRDAQTTGGYARILQLSRESINILAQKRPGEKVFFQLY
ncbi:biotin-dependent carboxyltransferase family protein [Patiriisocius sp. Uisw_017]|jgi:biotin-dependent carboxylase-like uncharacterized protein|uniref:5-oxoprolinase subunit C family protein n=1 Tax=Patiriisocius sp. Uisw_017 TaxID=3230968 RepID=UPI0039EBBB1D